MDQDNYRKCKLVLAAIFGALLIVVLYLFALNGRYTVNSDGETIVDKWTLEYVDGKITE